MKLQQDQKNHELSNENEASLETSVFVKSYHELADQSVQEVSDLEHLQKQMKQLEALHQRSRFMVREISYLMKIDE